MDISHARRTAERRAVHRTDIPFLSQWELADDPALPPVPAGPTAGSPPAVGWAPRACGIACATMVLRHHGNPVSMADVLRTALGVDAWDPQRAWRHAQLVDVLGRFGVPACRRNWRLLDGREDSYLAGRPPSADTEAELAWVRGQMLEEGWWTVDRALSRGVPVIASVRRPVGPGHQIVLTGRVRDTLYHHDPFVPDGAFLALPVDVFLDQWKATAIIPGAARGVM